MNTMLSNVNYTIKWPDDFHQPGIINITNNDEHKTWSSKKPTQSISIHIEHPRCCLQRFDIFSINTPNIQIIFQDTVTQTTIYSKTINVFNSSDPSQKIQKLHKEVIKDHQRKMSDEIEIILSSEQERNLGLRYFFIYKETENEKKTQPSTKYDKVHVKSDPHSNLPQIIFDSEEENLQMVLKLSRDQYESSRNGKFKVQQEQKLSNLEKTEIQNNQQLKLSDIKVDNRLLKILDDVTDEWKRWEEQAEHKRHIPKENSITKYWRTKLFEGVKFSAFLSSRKDQRLIIQSALRLGFIYISQPVSQGYVFCENKQVLRGKLNAVRDIKILKPSYIEDCLQRWKVLDIKDYILR